MTARRLILIALLIAPLLFQLVAAPYPAAADDWNPPTLPEGFRSESGLITWDGSAGLAGFTVTHDEYISCEWSPDTILQASAGADAPPSAQDNGAGSAVGEVLTFRCWVTVDAEEVAGFATWNYHHLSWWYESSTNYWREEAYYADTCTYDDSPAWGCYHYPAGERGTIQPWYYQSPGAYFNTYQGNDFLFGTAGWAKDIRYVFAQGNTPITSRLDDIEFSYYIAVCDACAPEEPDEPPNASYTRPLAQEYTLDNSDLYTLSNIKPAVWDIDGAFGNYFLQPYTLNNIEFLYDPEIDIVYTDDTGPPIDNEYLLIYKSLENGTPIHSPVDGVISSIEPFTADDCETIRNISPITVELADIVLIVAGGLTGQVTVAGAGLLGPITDQIATLLNIGSEQWCMIDAQLGTDPDYSGGFNDLVWQFHYIDQTLIDTLGDVVLLPVGDIVAIEDYARGITLYYWVANAEEYLTEGQAITAGCVLGQTLPVWLQVDNQGETIINKTEAGIGFIWAENSIGGAFDIRNDFMYYPTEDQPCNTPDFRECINGNPDLDPVVPYYWYTGLGYDPIDSWLDMTSGDTLQQTIAAPGGQLAVQLSASVQTPPTGGGSASVVVTLGDTPITFAIPSGASFSDYEPLDLYTDSDYDGPVLDLSVEVNDDSEVRIDRVCVSTEEPEIEPVAQCVFVNSGFADLSGWTLTGGASIIHGALNLPTGATASSDLQLNPDTYTISARYRPLPLTAPPPGGYSVSFDWDIDDDSGTMSGTSSEWRESTGSLTIATSGAYTFTLDGTATTDTVQIDSVCLTPENLPVNTKDAACNACPTGYVGDLDRDFVEGIEWLDCRARELYYCDMRQILTDTRDGVNETVRGIGMAGRWASATISKQNIWLRSGFYWLGGYLQNMALMIQDSIAWQSGYSTVVISDQPLGFWDVLGLLITGLSDTIQTALNSIVQVISYLVPIAGMLLDAALAALDVVQSVIAALLNVINTVTVIAAAALNSMNADPQTIAGLPNCAPDLMSGDADFYCWGFYVLDNTIFSGPAAYFLPIVMAASALNLLFWAWSRIRDAVAEAA